MWQLLFLGISSYNFCDYSAILLIQVGKLAVTCKRVCTYYLRMTLDPCPETVDRTTDNANDAINSVMEYGVVNCKFSPKSGVCDQVIPRPTHFFCDQLEALD